MELKVQETEGGMLFVLVKNRKTRESKGKGRLLLRVFFCLMFVTQCQLFGDPTLTSHLSKRNGRVVYVTFAWFCVPLLQVFF